MTHVAKMCAGLEYQGKSPLTTSTATTTSTFTATTSSTTSQLLFLILTIMSMGLGVLFASGLRDSQVLCSEMSAIVDRGSVERESVQLSYSVQAAMSASLALSDSFAFSWQRIAEVRRKEASGTMSLLRAPFGTQRAGFTGKSRDSAGPGHGGLGPINVPFCPWQ